MNCRFSARFVPFGWRHERMSRRPQEESATKASAVIVGCRVVRLPTEREAVRFEKYLKSGSGRAFATRHFDPVKTRLGEWRWWPNPWCYPARRAET